MVVVERDEQMRKDKRRKSNTEKTRKRKDRPAQRNVKSVRNEKNLAKSDKINWDQYEGTISAQLCEQYHYRKDNDEFYFITPKAFFVVDERALPVTCKLEDDRRTVKEIGNSTFYCSIIRSLYVCERYRGQGVQKGILKSVIGASEKTGKCILAIADPFRLTGRTHKKNPLICLNSFLEGDAYETFKDKELIRLQSKRFQKLGFQSIDWTVHAQITEKESHNIYVPENAGPEEKMIVESIKDGWKETAL